MAKTDLVVGLVLLDKFSKTTDKFQSELKKSGSASSAFSKAAGQMGAALSVGAVVAFGVSSVKAYGDALESQQKLQETYAKMPQLANVNVGALQEWNKELSTKIAYDDDDIAAAESNLALFKLTGDQIQTLTPLVADLARRKGIDLVTAATAVGKAMQGQAKGLKDVGIVFKATGDQTKDYANLQALLNQQVGGFAESFAKNNPLGQLQNMQVAFGNMQESIGKALVPAMTALTNIMTPLANALGSIPAPIMQIGLGMAAAGLAGRLLGPAMASAATGMRMAMINATGATGAVRGLAAAQTMAAGAGKGLMAMMGGPWGAAIMVAGTALAFFATQQSDAADKTSELSGILEYQDGVLTNASKAAVIKKLADAKVFDDIKAAGLDTTEFLDNLFSGDYAKQGQYLDKLFALHAGQSNDYIEINGRVMDAFSSNRDALYAIGLASKSADNAMSDYGVSVNDASANTDVLAVKTDKVAASLAAATSVTTRITNAYGMASVSAIRDAIANIKVAQSLLNVALAGEQIRPQQYLSSMSALKAEKSALNDMLKASIAVYGNDTKATHNNTAATVTLTDKQKEALATALRLGSALSAITDERDSFVSGINSASMSYATVMGFDPSAFATASATVQEAIKSETTARQALFSIAAGPSPERVKAEQDLADATAARQKAEKDAQAVAVTKPNILATYQDRLSKLRKFSQAIKGLISKKLSPMILQDILSAGVDGGLAMAEALNSDKTLIGNFNKTATDIVKATAGLSFNAAQYVYKPYVGQASNDYDAAYKAAPASERGDKVHVVLKLESKTVYEALLRLKRERGGQLLGL